MGTEKFDFFSVTMFDPNPICVCWLPNKPPKFVSAFEDNNSALTQLAPTHARTLTFMPTSSRSYTPWFTHVLTQTHGSTPTHRHTHIHIQTHRFANNLSERLTRELWQVRFPGLTYCHKIHLKRYSGGELMQGGDKNSAPKPLPKI